MRWEQGVVVGLLASAALGPVGADTAPASTTRGSAPMIFTANRGQTDPRVAYEARGRDYGLYLTADEAVLAVGDSTASGLLRLHPEGARASRPQAEQPLPGSTSYFLGSDPTKWIRAIPQHGAVRYADLYPGIDLVFHGRDGEVEYDFVVAPGADPRALRMRLIGADRLRLDATGNLDVTLASGVLRQRAPLLYQEIDGIRQAVVGGYRITGRDRFSFNVGRYDRRYPLVIDPVVSWSTFLGGDQNDRADGIAVDTAGNVHVTGRTASANFPLSTPPLFGTPGGQDDVFITKLDPSGQTILFSTFLGGVNNDRGLAIAVDATGNVIVCGETNSVTTFPLGPTPIQATFGGGVDAFVAAVDSTGTTLLHSTYLGGIGNDRARALAVNPLGDAFLTGETQSDLFPTTPDAIQPTRRGGNDAFVTQVAAGGAALVYSSFLGGAGDDIGRGLTLDSVAAVYVTGDTDEDTFPAPTPIVPFAGNRDGFVTKLVTAGPPAIVYSTFLGGNNDDRGSGIAVDAAGQAWVVGETDSDDFPLLDPYQPIRRGNNDVFVTVIDAAGAALVASTLLGGTGNDRGYAIAVDGAGGAWFAGETGSMNFPLATPTLATYGGGNDGFLARLNIGRPPVLVHSTFVGDAQGDRVRALAVTPCGAPYLAGDTGSPNFFPVPGPLQVQPTIGGGNDAFIVANECAPLSDIAIVKALAPGQDLTPAPGDPVGFVIRVVNTGTGPSLATVDDVLDACLLPLGGAGSPCDLINVDCAGAACSGATCTYTANGFQWSSSLALAPGESVVLTVTAIAGATPGPCGNSATSTDADPDIEESRAVVDIIAVPAIVVRKSVLPASVATGVDAQFKIEIDNTAGLVPANCQVSDIVDATGCMTLRTCDLTTPPLALLCAPPTQLSTPGPGFTVAAGGLQEILFTARAGLLENPGCVNTVNVTCDGIDYTADATLVIANAPGTCPLLYDDIAMPPATPTVNWPKAPPWVYTQACSAGGDPILSQTLQATAIAGDTGELAVDVAGSMRLYQVDCAASCLRELRLFKAPATGTVVVDLR